MNNINFFLKSSFFITITASLIFISSCGKKGGDKTDNKNLDSAKVSSVDTAGASTGDWVVIREMSDAEKMNPIVSTDASADEIQSYIFEALLNQDRITYDLIPGVAELPETAPDYLSYIFKLKKNVIFSDGKPLTGEDVIYTLKVIKIPFVDDAALRNYFESVQKAELVGGDPYTVKFTMNKPSWRGIYNLATFRILPKHILDPQGVMDKINWDDLKDFKTASKVPELQKYADFINSQEVSREAKYLIGSGPYIFEKWETNQNITIKRNPNYWDMQHTPNYPAKIIFKTISDNSAALVASKNKEVDAMFVVKPEDFYKNLENPAQFNLVKAKPLEPSYTYLGWNENSVLFQDKKVRLALSYLVDRKTIIDKILYGDAIPIQSPIFYESKKLLNSDLPVIEFNPDKAKQLLSEAGWKDSDNDGVLDKMINGKKTDFKFQFLINTNPVRMQVLLIVIDAMKKVGIQADLQQIEWSVYIEKTKKHDFEATYGAWTSPTTPPDPFQIWHSTMSKGEGSNYISFINDENDKLIEQYRDELDENKRIELIKKWQKLIYDEQPYTFLWSGKSRYIFDMRFKNARWYSYQPSPAYNEWWVPKATQKYTQTMN
jgi:peptide/nickel transport system substrate-binding protein